MMSCGETCPRWRSSLPERGKNSPRPLGSTRRRRPGSCRLRPGRCVAASFINRRAPIYWNSPLHLAEKAPHSGRRVQPIPRAAGRRERRVSLRSHFPRGPRPHHRHSRGARGRPRFPARKGAGGAPPGAGARKSTRSAAADLAALSPREGLAWRVVSLRRRECIPTHRTQVALEETRARADRAAAALAELAPRAEAAEAALLQERRRNAELSRTAQGATRPG